MDDTMDRDDQILIILGELKADVENIDKNTVEIKQTIKDAKQDREAIKERVASLEKSRYAAKVLVTTLGALVSFLGWDELMNWLGKGST